ncbi:MAG TPA: cupin domain-containing protein [Usitatibacter sp.]|nr:cupin domain-containing protein [Usitatibacter sp.]
MKSRNHPENLDVDRFMRRYWQREPLLLRHAFAGFRDPLSPAEVLALSGSPDAAARLVAKRGRTWSLEHGPFDARRLARLPPRDWTVLVQDTNHFSPRAAALLGCFDFIPHARVDDVMVSYAVPGGSVGPHVDSYDVFLLQGHGRRRWQISRQRDIAFVPGVPLKILERFVPEEEWTLEAGDMLYLPPGVAHHGVAETECLTWSIGFRAPSDDELARGFLDYVQDSVALEGHYADPGAAPARHPGEVPAAMLTHAERVIDRIRWRRGDVRDFAGCFLSEPKAQVYFQPPHRPLARAEFARSGARAGIALDAKSRLLFSGTIFFMNGERAPVAPAARAGMRQLADRRVLPGPLDLPREFWEAAHEWYVLGYLGLQRGKG